jgi:CheY-like chemotaxis protein/HPt (histidine-containing phosphotransfer) domain-containing protein
LAEDNAINQMVAVEILQGLGLRVSLANNGEEAIQMVTRERFDAVLMDIQMPGMDGYQATAKIRTYPHFSAEKLPIIAMTAHALSSDRDKAMEAGLNDYVSKPVDVAQLANVLVRWLAPHNHLPSAAGLAQPVLPCVELDVENALKRLGGNRALYMRLLAVFQQEHAQDVQALETAIQNNDFELSLRLAHTLKGVAGTIGASWLSELSRQMEHAIKNRESDFFETRLDELQNCLGATLQAISELELPG